MPGELLKERIEECLQRFDQHRSTVIQHFKCCASEGAFLQLRNGLEKAAVTKAEAVALQHPTSSAPKKNHADQGQARGLGDADLSN